MPVSACGLFAYSDGASAIGCGAEGPVFPGFRRDGVAVAVKVLREAWEALVTPCLPHHPNLLAPAPVEIGGERAEVTLLQHCDLAAVVARGRLGDAEAAGVIAALASALACLHAHGLCHGDVKCENVLVGDDGEVYLADFGQTRDLEERRVLRTSHFADSADIVYACGEEVFRDGYDLRAMDVYALGIVAEELLGAGAGSAAAQDFIASCTSWDSKLRPSAASLQNHPWLAQAAVSAPLADCMWALPHCVTQAGEACYHGLDLTM